MSYWGAKVIAAVASNGVATQLFPVGADKSGMADTTVNYPPNPAGNVRRPRDGKIISIHIAGDGTNAGTVELWDVAGLDRGATANGNVNNGDTLTDAYLTAHGTKIAVLQVQGSGGTNFTDPIESIPFNNGLAVRFYNGTSTGSVTVSADVEGGFNVRPVVC